MSFTDRLELGSIGERLGDSFLTQQGWIIYRPPPDCAHPFDRLAAMPNKRDLCIVEYKTKPRRRAYADTGINLAAYREYSYITETYRVPLFLAFIDSFEQRIYGNWWTALLTPYDGHGVWHGATFYGERYPWFTGGIVYFPLSAMQTLAELSAEDCLELQRRHRTGWQESA